MSIFAACFNRICDMIRLEKYRVWLLLAVLTICGTASFASCASNEGNGKGRNYHYRYATGNDAYERRLSG